MTVEERLNNLMGLDKSFERVMERVCDCCAMLASAGDEMDLECVCRDCPVEKPLLEELSAQYARGMLEAAMLAKDIAARQVEEIGRRKIC